MAWLSLEFFGYVFLAVFSLVLALSLALKAASQKNDAKAMLSIALAAGFMVYASNALNEIGLGFATESFNAVGIPFITVGLVVIGLSFLPRFSKTRFTPYYLLLFALMFFSATLLQVQKSTLLSTYFTVISGLIFLALYFKTKNFKLLFFLAGLVALAIGGFSRSINPLLFIAIDAIGLLLWFASFEFQFNKKPAAF